MNENDLTMYCVTHKPLKKVVEGRTPIFVGNGSNPQNFLRDNTGDNIAQKNASFCELTAMYWIWKNDHTSKYISIEHYRRYFGYKYPLFPISKKQILKYLKNNRVLETTKGYYGETVEGFYKIEHPAEDLDILKNVITELTPDYINAYKTVFEGEYCSICNMTAMSKRDFDSYCEWLFKILFYLEEKISIDERDTYQKRVFGFLAERLQNVWIEKNRLKVDTLPIYFTEKSFARRFLSASRTFFKYYLKS